jgi:hypothetical protein
VEAKSYELELWLIKYCCHISKNCQTLDISNFKYIFDFEN